MTPAPLFFAISVALLLGCGRAALPPDPPILAQRSTQELLNPSPVRELDVDHEGCFGTCPQYRVKLSDDGSWDWEGVASVSPAGRRSGRAYASRFSPLFIWLRDHPALYAASADRIRCQDCEAIEFRFTLKSGESVVVRYGMGFEGDDLWALSTIVDALIMRETSRMVNESNERRPAT
jgi:hypothetical protein